LFGGGLSGKRRTAAKKRGPKIPGPKFYVGRKDLKQNMQSQDGCY